AEENYRHALSANPHFADAHCNLAYLLYEKGRYDEAAGYFRQALATEPSHFDSLAGLAHATAESGDYAASADALKKALAIQPSDADLWNDLGNAMLALENHQAADAAYLNALKLQPDSCLAHYNYANFLLQQNRIDEAARHYRSALTIEPEHIEARINLASCAKLLGDLDTAVATYREIVARNPDSAQNHLNLALALLSQGNFKEGWQVHESRLNFPSEQARVYPYPRWSGEALAGKSILIWGERGYGDEIQFARFLPALRALGAHVIFECRTELYDLLQRANLCDQLVLQNSAPISHDIDYQLPLLSLPLMLGIDSLSKLPNKAFLSADPALAEYWKTQLAEQTKMRVGLVWAGNPQHKNDSNRSIPFHVFSRIAQRSDMAFYSLQKNSGQWDCNGLGITDHTDKLKNFSDTAALIENLDLVISVDTAVAHLAATMGKPTWVLIARDYDWRWLADRSDSPWYPSVRVFRQCKVADWKQVLEDIDQALSRWFTLGPQS
ncbi:MAG: tetratricopeptide repeat protein, partial [Burkholderiaceae bacterium]